MELNENVGRFTEKGLNVVAISYDSPERNSRFSESRSLSYSLLSDVNAATVKKLGILNEGYVEDHPAYGIPHPGIILAGVDGKVLSKYAVPKYSERPDLTKVLDDIGKVLNQQE